MDDDRIPTSETYKGVGIHAGQSAKRVAAVRRAIDQVIETDDLAELNAILSDPPTPPEARAFAGRKMLTVIDSVAADRQKRPRGIDRGAVDGTVAALESARWRCPTHYGSLLEPQGGLVPREKPLAD